MNAIVDRYVPINKRAIYKQKLSETLSLTQTRIQSL